MKWGKKALMHEIVVLKTRAVKVEMIQENTDGSQLKHTVRAQEWSGGSVLALR